MSVKRLRLPVQEELGADYPFPSARSLLDVSTSRPVKRVVVTKGEYGQLRHDLEKFFRRLGRGLRSG